MRMVLALMAGIAATSAMAETREPIALRDMGSFKAAGGSTRTPTRWRR